MAAIKKPTSRADFRIAIICALAREADAVTLLFDEFWDDDGDVFGRAKGDTNTYVTGRLGIHNVVLVTAPAMGTTSAASTAVCLRLSFAGVKLALLIGVCGGIPEINGCDVFLGDVVISKTVIQYDYGRRYPNHFETKDTIDDKQGRASKDIRGLLASVETEFGRERLHAKAVLYLKSLQEAAIRKRRRAKYHYPGMSKDRLFSSKYRHSHRKSCDTCCDGSIRICELAIKASCEDLGCSDAHMVDRKRLDAGGGHDPAIFIGCVGSSNTVMRSGEDRDRISAEHGVIAFEMEGAGAWDEVPCIVIKGICDYSDSHKNKAWQDYAAATAAAVGRALLERYIWEDGDGATGESRRPLRMDDSTTNTDAQSQATIVKFGKQNSGFQAGTINGSVSGLTFGGLPFASQPQYLDDTSSPPFTVTVVQIWTLLLNLSIHFSRQRIRLLFGVRLCQQCSPFAHGGPEHVVKDVEPAWEYRVSSRMIPVVARKKTEAEIGPLIGTFNAVTEILHGDEM